MTAFTAFTIGALIGGNAILWTEVISRAPKDGGYRTGVFEEHPMVGVAVVCFAAVAAMWIHGAL